MGSCTDCDCCAERHNARAAAKSRARRSLTPGNASLPLLVTALVVPVSARSCAGWRGLRSAAVRSSNAAGVFGRRSLLRVRGDDVGQGAWSWITSVVESRKKTCIRAIYINIHDFIYTACLLESPTLRLESVLQIEGSPIAMLTAYDITRPGAPGLSATLPRKCAWDMIPPRVHHAAHHRRDVVAPSRGAAQHRSSVHTTQGRTTPFGTQRGWCRKEAWRA